MRWPHTPHQRPGVSLSDATELAAAYLQRWVDDRRSARRIRELTARIDADLAEREARLDWMASRVVTGAENHLAAFAALERLWATPPGGHR